MTDGRQPFSARLSGSSESKALRASAQGEMGGACSRLGGEPLGGRREAAESVSPASLAKLWTGRWGLGSHAVKSVKSKGLGTRPAPQ